MHESLLGAQTGFYKMRYNWRDMAIYALAVGATENDLLYTYEKNMKALPSFGVTPYFSAIGTEPPKPQPYAACYLANDLLSKEMGKAEPIGLHMGHELIMYRPFDPIQGVMVYNDVVTEVYVRGEGKGLVVVTECPVYDEAGRLICKNRSKVMLRQGGGYGGPKMPKEVIEYPEREPDYVVEETIGRVQNVLYRLTGDTADVHVDPEKAKRITDRGPFMHGLCSFGYACRMLINAIIPGEPERMTRISVQMRAISYPGTPVRLEAWKVADHKVSFRYIDVESGKAILDNCEFDWK